MATKAQVEEAGSRGYKHGYEVGFNIGTDEGYDHGFNDGVVQEQEESGDSYQAGVDAGWAEADEWYKDVCTDPENSCQCYVSGHEDGYAEGERNGFVQSQATVKEALNYWINKARTWRYIAARRLAVGFFLGVGLTVLTFLLKK